MKQSVWQCWKDDWLTAVENWEERQCSSRDSTIMQHDSGVKHWQGQVWSSQMTATQHKHYTMSSTYTAGSSVTVAVKSPLSLIPSSVPVPVPFKAVKPSVSVISSVPRFPIITSSVPWISHISAISHILVIPWISYIPTIPIPTIPRVPNISVIS